MPSEYERRMYARTSCLPCRRGKRRCDRKVPSCNLCTRKEVECSYPARRDGNQNHNQNQNQSQNQNQNQIQNQQLPAIHSSEPELPNTLESDANAIYFIAPHIFQQARLEIPRLNPPISLEISSIIGDASSIRNIATSFFITVHRWLPIISKRGFFAYLLNPLAKRRTELNLLTLCMKLCTTTPSNEDGKAVARTDLYRITKRFHHEAEATGILSIHILQAGILIGFYEMSQAIYPAAYLTVGSCARYGLALGIDKFSRDLPGDGDGSCSWNEIEERRRVWWAIIMFDRFLNLTNPKRALSTEDPTFDTYLPVDDVAWDDWKAKPGDAVRISTGFNLKMGNFARLAQATFLLSQALRTISSSKPAEDEVSHQDQIVQLRRTLLALVHTADSEATIRRLEFCAQSAVSLGTILLLQEYQLQERDNVDTENSNLSVETLWVETRTALNRLSSAADSYNTTCPKTPEASDNVPICLIHVMYQAACILLRLTPCTMDDETKRKLDTIRRLLVVIDSRWRLAGVYLNILEALEITISSETIKMHDSILLTRLGFPATI